MRMGNVGAEFGEAVFLTKIELEGHRLLSRIAHLKCHAGRLSGKDGKLACGYTEILLGCKLTLCECLSAGGGASTWLMPFESGWLKLFIQ